MNKNECKLNENKPYADRLKCLNFSIPDLRYNTKQTVINLQNDCSANPK